FPCDVVGYRNEFRAERPHPFQLRSWRGLNHHDGAWHTRLSRRVGYPLSSVSRTDCPDSALALGIGKECHGVRCAAQLIGINRLQVLQLESNVRKTWSELQTDQRRPNDRVGNSFARLLYL